MEQSISINFINFPIFPLEIQLWIQYEWGVVSSEKDKKKNNYLFLTHLDRGNCPPRKLWCRWYSWLKCFKLCQVLNFFNSQETWPVRRMPITKIPITHKFGIISQSQREELQSRLLQQKYQKASSPTQHQALRLVFFPSTRSALH